MLGIMFPETRQGKVRPKFSANCFHGNGSNILGESMPFSWAFQSRAKLPYDERAGKCAVFPCFHRYDAESWRLRNSVYVPI